MATPIDVLFSNFVKFVRREIGDIVRCLPDRKKNLVRLSRCRCCAYRAQNLPGPAPVSVLKSAPDFIQIGSLSAEL